MDDMVVCRCEEVSLATLMASLRTGARTPQELKLRTRAGMGICQGRTCRPLLELLTGTNSIPTASGGLSHRVPVRPLLLSDFIHTTGEGEQA